MKFECVCILIVLWIVCCTEVGSDGNNENPSAVQKILHRRKRYVVFPEGSSFSVAVCLAVGILGQPDHNLMSFAVNWGLAYDLPNETKQWDVKSFYFPKSTMQRRHRRDLYQRIETVFHALGFDGRSCIYRALCEASQRLLPQSGNLVTELIRTIFTLPMRKVYSFEPEEHSLYDSAHRKGRIVENCRDLYPQCTISLLDMAIGSQHGFS